MTVLEFHTVPRPDLVPPRPAMTFPSSAEAVPVPDGARLITTLALPRTEMAQRITGKTCVMTWHRLGPNAKPAEVFASGSELLVYLLRGTLQLEATDAPQRVTPGSVILIPAGQHVRFHAADTEVTLVDFGVERR